MSPIFVVIGGGVLIGVFDSSGEVLDQHLIDYDLEESGECPVCHEEIEQTDICLTCGYVFSEGNGLETAIAHYRKDMT